MENKSILETLAQYRLKVEKDGKPIVDVPGLLALPGLLMAPKLSLTGLVAAPLLGCQVHLEGEDGKAVDVEGKVRDAAEAVVNTAGRAARTIREEVEKAWEAMSADDPAEEPDAEKDAKDTQEDETVQDIVEDLEKQAKSEIPTIQVNPDDSTRA